jgi:putative transposase
MVNDCIRIGLENDISARKNLSKLCYPLIAKYDIMSYYRLYAISHAARILTNRKKSIKRGLQPRQPYATRPLLVSCYGFKIINGVLKVPVGDRKYFGIPLNAYARSILSDSKLQVRSFTLSANNTVSICYSRGGGD